MEASIVIPTYNEENYLPALLDSLKKQSASWRINQDYEIIVSDNKSTDRTREIAQEYGCRIVDGGLPSASRNRGAAAAQGDLVFFFDADVVLPDNFLLSALNKFEQKKADLAAFSFSYSKKVDRFFSLLMDFLMVVTQNFYPHAFGGALLVRKNVHEKIGGFDEKILLAEEFDYARRIAKIGKFKFFRTPYVITSSRRFEKEGRIRLCLKYFLVELYIIFFGNVKSDIFKYKFSHYNEDIKK